MKLIRSLFLISFLSFPVYLFAAPDISISLNPQYPSPNEKVILTLQSYSFDINTSNIAWFVQGKQVSSGVGNKTITITTGNIGENTTVNVNIKTPDGENLRSQMIVSPESVGLIWESKESYIPPFYEGKALPGEGSLVRVTAIPTMSDGSGQLPANTLSYMWYTNDNFLEDSSGYNKQSATFYLDYLSSKTDVKVRVKSVSGLVSEKTISIYPHDVMPIFYSYDELFGLNTSFFIEKRLETTRDFTLAVAPYYLSSNGDLQSSTSYIWLLNGSPITPEKNTNITFHPQENSFGTKTLSVIINSTKRRLQKAESNLEILFDTRN